MPRKITIAEQGFLFGIASLLWAGHALAQTDRAALSGFENSIASDEMAFHATGDEGRWMAFNRWQGLIGTIDAGGFTIQGPIPDTRWAERFTVKGCSRSTASVFTNTVLDLTHGERALRWHGTLMDLEYVHSEQGLRQNFIVHERLEGTDALRVELALSGDLIPSINQQGSLSLHDAEGQERFQYRDLRVWDATGAALTAHLELSPLAADRSLFIVVDDAAAVYPITIDPISATVSTLLTGAGGFEFGIAVATAGDLNRDGRSDVVVGAWQATLGQANEGAAYVYYGTNTGIAVAPSIVLQCDQAVAQMGCAVSTAGDVNGDGYSDLLVGARTWESAVGEQSEGAVFVYYGSATGVAALPNLTLQPNHLNDNFGSNVACAGDINNDGFSDVLVGAYLAEYPTYQEGAVWVFLGSAAGLNTVATHRLERNTSAAHFGRSIAGAGDVNGDGFSDVIVGSPDWLNVNPDAGAAFVYYGSATNLGGGMNPAPSLTLFGSTLLNGSFGWSVTTAGDVNGDGFSDVAVSAYFDGNGQVQEGTVRVFHGSAAGLNTVPVTIIESNQANAWMGRWVSTAGDMNGDGYADLLVGVEQWANPEALEGAGFLYFGSSAGIPTAASLTFELNSPGANLGGCVSTAGDVNGDGYSDMILGARIYGLGGAAAIYLGGPYNVNALPSRTWTGGVAGNRLGWSIANAGDVNGDGFADALLSAPDASNGQAGEGRVYLYNGSATGLGAVPSATLEANVAGAQFGYSVATAGDVNGDGYSDVIIGAPLSGGTGAAYVFMGSPAGLNVVPALTLGGTPASRFGASVATAGDINSDGRSDVLIGAPDISTVYVHMGTGGGTSPAPLTTLFEAPVGNLFGSSVATAGDVNGDGFSDVIIGSPNYNNGQPGEGAAFVYHGALSGLVTPWAIRLESNLAGASYGCSVAGAGDVNGNGFFDVIVGAELWESGQTDEGAAFVYYGTAAGITVAGATTVQRNIVNGHLGHSVAEAGDVNGDGYADVVIGAPLHDNPTVDEGQALVFRGSAAGLSVAGPDLLEPNITNYQQGWCVSGGGDVDGDGYSDVLTGAPFANPVAANEGMAYWYRGGIARGLLRLTRQYDADLVTPLSTNCMDYSDPNRFGIGHLARSPISRMLGKLQYEVVFEGQPFSGAPITNSVSNTGISVAWSNLPATGVEIKELIVKVPGYIRYKWRVRVEYAMNKMLDGQRYSRWFYGFAAGHGDIGVLPVELLEFTGHEAGPTNQLFWTTATENNSDHFTVERASNGTFVPMGIVNAAGESLEEIDYAFIDAAPPTGIAMYRLRIVDRDGQEDLSPVIAIIREGTGATVFPNPTEAELNLLLEAHSGVARVRILDDLGRTIAEYAVDPDMQLSSFSTAQLRAGHYALLLLGAQGEVIDRLPFVKR